MTNSFSEEEIQRLFGHEAAEDEDPKRLRQYYLKTATYEQVRAELPLRIVVGHKGIGKSALFRIAMAEDVDNDRVAVLIRPDDVLGLGADTSDFLKTTRNWKEGLTEIIAQKVLSSLGSGSGNLSGQLKGYGGLVIDFLRQTLQSDKFFTLNPAKRIVVDNFIQRASVSVYIDDLDRGWLGQRQDVLRLSALLNAVRDIANANTGIRFRIGLRSDVYIFLSGLPMSLLTNRELRELAIVEQSRDFCAVGEADRDISRARCKRD